MHVPRVELVRMQILVVLLVLHARVDTHRLLVNKVLLSYFNWCMLTPVTHRILR